MSSGYIIMIMACIIVFVLGLRTVTDDGKIFCFIREYFMRTKKRKVTHPCMNGKISVIEVKVIPEYISKPLILCAACMPSFWGTIIFWMMMCFYHEQIEWIMIAPQWLFSCVGCSFFSFYIWHTYECLKK